MSILPCDFALSASSTRLTTPPSDSNTYCEFTSLTVTPGMTSESTATAFAGLPSALTIATLSRTLPATTTPVNWKLLATAKVAGRPPNSPAAASILTSGGALCGAAATGRTAGLNNCSAQKVADAHSAINITKVASSGQRFI